MLNTPNEKKSLAITVSIYAVLFLLLFFFGLSYLDPATEEGIAVNLGYSDYGSGNKQPLQPVKSAPAPKPNPVAPQTTETPQEVSKVAETKTLTQDNTDAPVVASKKEETKPKVEQLKEVKKEIPKPVERKPDSSTKNALDSFLNGPKKDGTSTSGEGNDDVAGDKGKSDGDPNAKSYYGTGKGLDGDGNYRLGGRKALNKEKRIPDCNESGTVVVRIVVDRNGKVLSATPGIKGTTNTATCLMKPARAAALATKFNSDNKAPSKQVGSIAYTFKLSE